jgi:histone acetyltransferase 1
LIEDHFKNNITEDEKKFQSWIKHDLEKFKPAGKRVYQFDRIQDKHRHYEVFKVSLKDKKFNKEMNRSLQALLFFYIESASFIEEDPCWNYFLLYEVVRKFKSNPPSYRLIGFCTTFEDLEGRKAVSRISQFLVLPAYQKQGFGKALVEGIYKYYIEDDTCHEIGVEKPTKAFESLCESVKASLLSEDSKTKRSGIQSENKKTKK